MTGATTGYDATDIFVIRGAAPRRAPDPANPATAAFANGSRV